MASDLSLRDAAGIVARAKNRAAEQLIVLLLDSFAPIIPDNGGV